MVKNIKSIRKYKENEELISKEISNLFEESFALTMDNEDIYPDNYLIRKALFRLEEIEKEYKIKIINKSMFAVVLVLTDNFGHGNSKDFEEVTDIVKSKGELIIDKLVTNITNLLEKRKIYLKS
jgi:hypothetical protein